MVAKKRRVIHKDDYQILYDKILAQELKNIKDLNLILTSEIVESSIHFYYKESLSKKEIFIGKILKNDLKDIVKIEKFYYVIFDFLKERIKKYSINNLSEQLVFRFFQIMNDEYIINEKNIIFFKGNKFHISKLKNNEISYNIIQLLESYDLINFNSLKNDKYLDELYQNLFFKNLELLPMFNEKNIQEKTRKLMLSYLFDR